MKIAVFFSDSPFASYAQSQGFPQILERMGHTVTAIGIPPTKQVKRSDAERINKPIDDCELVIVSGPEHLQGWINQFYPQWKTLKMPKVAYYHESMHAREDYQIDFSQYSGLYDFHCFPDADDAEKYKGLHLPLGVDTEMFTHWKKCGTCGGYAYICPECEVAGGFDTILQKRDIDCAFVGLMYPKRQRFAEALQPHLNGLNVRIANGSILVQDIDGINGRKSAELLAETYRRIKVFVAFPSLCNVLVAKILESMASGCYLVAPKQPVDLVNYAAYDDPKGCADAIRAALADSEMRERVARAGVQEVSQNHQMQSRFEKIFQLIGAKAECASV